MRKWQTAHLGLINKRTGELYDAELSIAHKSGGGRFMKVWQGTGWDEKLVELQGISLRILWHLVSIAKWQNEVPGPGEVAASMSVLRPNVSRAYAELTKAGLLSKIDGVYRLSPLFCWKGTDEQYESAMSLIKAREIMAPYMGRVTEVEKQAIT